MDGQGMSSNDNSLLCPACLGELSEPVYTGCDHVICVQCSEEMPRVQLRGINGQLGYHCTICGFITLKENIRRLQNIEQVLIVKATSLDNKMLNKCDKCQSKRPTDRCIDCKENFCDSCRLQHDTWSLMSHHRWQKQEVAISNGDINGGPDVVGGVKHKKGTSIKPVLDRHVFCIKHPDETVKLHCLDCQCLICLYCYSEIHQSHKCETIDDTIGKTRLIMNKLQRIVENRTSRTEESLHTLRSNADHVMKGYTETKKTLRAHCEQVISQVREDFRKLMDQLGEAQDRQLREIEDCEKKLETKLRSERNIISMTESTLEICKGTSLLQALQEDILPILKASENQKDKGSNLTESAKELQAAFVPKDLPAINLIGTIVGTGNTKGNVKLAQRSLVDITKEQFIVVKEIKSIEQSVRFLKVGEEIWFVNYDSNIVTVCDLNGTKLKSIKIDQIGHFRSIINIGNSNMIVATSSGLYLAKMTKLKTRCILNGDICDATFTGGKLFALEDIEGKVFTFFYDTTRQIYIHKVRFAIAKYQRSHLNTIKATPDSVFIAQYAGHCILQYTHEGTPLAVFGSFGKQVGQLFNPIICGIDIQMNVLIADRYNDRLVVLSTDGKWHVLRVEHLHEPAFALIDRGRLLLLQRNQVFKQYVHQ